MSMEPEQHEKEIGEPAGLPDVEETDEDVEAPAAGLGALGQLAAAVVAVAILVLVFMGGSAVLRRVFG